MFNDYDEYEEIQGFDHDIYGPDSPISDYLILAEWFIKHLPDNQPTKAPLLTAYVFSVHAQNQTPPLPHDKNLITIIHNNIIMYSLHNLRLIIAEEGNWLNSEPISTIIGSA